MQAVPKTRQPRGKGRLKPQHLEYVRLIQSGTSRYDAAIQAGFNKYTAQKAKERIEGLPEVKKLIELAHTNAQLAGQYGLKEAVIEVDKAIGFAYEQENPNAIAKLLEHKSKLYGLLIERVDIKTTYIDLKGALEQAKERVLIHLNPERATQNRGIADPNISSPVPNSLPFGNTQSIQSDTPDQTPSPLTPLPQSLDKTEAELSLLIPEPDPSKCFDVHQ